MTIEDGAEDMKINKSYVKGRLDEKERILRLLRENKYKMKPIIITNHDKDEIKVKSEYDEKAEVYRVDIKLKKLKPEPKWHGRTYVKD